MSKAMSKGGGRIVKKTKNTTHRGISGTISPPPKMSKLQASTGRM